MSQYFLSSRPLSTGKYVLHRIGCPILWVREPGIFLGTFEDAGKAVTESRRFYRKVGTCPFCMKKYRKKKARYSNVALTDYSGTQARSAGLTPLWDSFMLCGVN